MQYGYEHRRSEFEGNNEPSPHTVQEAELAYYDAMAAYSRLADLELQIAQQVKHAYFEIYYLEFSNKIKGRHIRNDLSFFILLDSTSFRPFRRRP